MSLPRSLLRDEAPPRRAGRDGPVYGSFDTARKTCDYAGNIRPYSTNPVYRGAPVFTQHHSASSGVRPRLPELCARYVLLPLSVYACATTHAHRCNAMQALGWVRVVADFGMELLWTIKNITRTCDLCYLPFRLLHLYCSR